jgi:hypothetical protein
MGKESEDCAVIDVEKAEDRPTTTFLTKGNILLVWYVCFPLLVSLLYCAALVCVIYASSGSPNNVALLDRANVTSIHVPPVRVISEDGRSVFTVECSRGFEDQFLCVASAGWEHAEYVLPITLAQDYDGRAPALVCSFLENQMVGDSCWFKTSGVALPIPLEKYFYSFSTGAVAVSFGLIVLACLIFLVACVMGTFSKPRAC